VHFASLAKELLNENGEKSSNRSHPLTQTRCLQTKAVFLVSLLNTRTVVGVAGVDSRQEHPTIARQGVGNCTGLVFGTWLSRSTLSHDEDSAVQLAEG
jgi:hypothetical protein